MSKSPKRKRSLTTSLIKFSTPSTIFKTMVQTRKFKKLILVHRIRKPSVMTRFSTHGMSTKENSIMLTNLIMTLSIVMMILRKSLIKLDRSNSIS